MAFPPKESYQSRMAWIAHRREHKRRLDNFARYHNGNNAPPVVPPASPEKKES